MKPGNIREIETFDDLWFVEEDLYERAASLDLMFIRRSIRLIDGYLLILGGDAKEHITTLFLSDETRRKEFNHTWLLERYGIK